MLNRKANLKDKHKAQYEAEKKRLESVGEKVKKIISKVSKK